jgi:hypothetical protein
VATIPAAVPLGGADGASSAAPPLSPPARLRTAPPPLRRAAPARSRARRPRPRRQPTDGPIHYRQFQGMDNWDYMMQNRDARLIATVSTGKAAWWDFAGTSPSRKPAA